MIRRFGRVAGADGAAWVELVGDEARVLDAAPWNGGAPTGASGPADAPRLAPVVPSKIVCVGRNYRAHASELGHEVPVEPLLFFKPPSSVLDPGGTIELPPATIASRIDHEAEVGVVIGRRTRRVDVAGAAASIFGVTAVGDITARDLQKKDGQWARAKGMDSFCPVGPVVVTGLETGALDVTCRVNGSTRQRGNTRDLIFSIPELIAYVSAVMTLEPGDLLVTGTPAGVGPLVDGDELEIAVEGVGVLTARVRA